MSNIGVQISGLGLAVALGAGVSNLPVAQAADIPADGKESQLASKLVTSAEITADGRSAVVPARNDERVDIVVTLRETATATPGSRAQEQLRLAAKWSKSYGLRITRNFDYLLNGFSATIPASQLNAFSREPELTNVHRTRLYYPTDQLSREAQHVNAMLQQHASLDGKGMLVSIIDSGIDPRHQDMGLTDWDKANNGACPDYVKLKNVKESHITDAKYKEKYGDVHFTCKVPNGYNYADASEMIVDTGASHMHGMHVAGIVAANGDLDEHGKPAAQKADLSTNGRILGVAPNAQLLAMKVFSNEGRGAREDDIVAAIQDSVEHGRCFECGQLYC